MSVLWEPTPLNPTRIRSERTTQEFFNGLNGKQLMVHNSIVAKAISRPVMVSIVF